MPIPGELEQIDKNQLIGSIIKLVVNHDFNIKDYSVEKSIMEDDIAIVKIYDFRFTINNIKTNVGYTVYLNEEETEILSIYDNMKGLEFLNLKASDKTNLELKVRNLTEIKRVRAQNMVLAKHYQNNVDKTVDSANLYYDILENKLYYNISIKEIIQGSEEVALILHSIEL